ncbi:MAG: hypothetical protein K9H49_18665 [Bacteroidales bacterium]|nr:hypothetical protein [Bacteroidales bacterium]MCF8391625.1 hypothetical protein [Bacteroidales bacterium]
MKKLSLLLLISSITIASFSQVPPATPADARIKSFETRKSLKENSLVRDVEFRNVGPVNMSGRIVDVDVNEADPSEFYAAYASGGLFYTRNNGTTFEPVFDNQEVLTIGDIAVDWNNGTLWVGTGENNSSRSSYSGTGIFKSLDHGKNWKNMGLPESHHISRIIIHPENPDIVWVAVIGHLYSPNEERGLYKTTDGGQSWSKTLSIDENTGVIDLVIDPVNPDILYAAAWERERRAWNFSEGGKGSGIYKSIDGGNEWTKISGNKSGFPEGEGIGRIGLAIFPGNSDILYAFLDNQTHKEKTKEGKTEALSKEDLKEMSSEAFLAFDEKKIINFLKENRFPAKYDIKTVKEMVKAGKIKPAALAEYLEDENSLMFDTPIIGAELYKSEDGGKSWKKTHENTIEGVIYTYGYYFGNIRVAPKTADEIYLLGVPLLFSEDGGKTFKALSSENMHSDHHALWINPNREGHLINGNDGGLNISYDKGETWIKANVPSVGQFYSVNYDLSEPYNVYGGLQDNGVWFGPSTYNPENAWHHRGRDPYKAIGGGDGMMVEVDWRDNVTLYSGSQFGSYYRYNSTTGDRMGIQPRHELGERPLRFNWETPIYLSRHNQDILYYGANRLFRSMKQGEDLIAVSPDLTNGGIKGDVSYGTLSSINESPLKFGLIYTGSDDGAVYVSKNGGDSWTSISKGLPEKMWVSQVFASKHKESRVYVSLNGYRWDNFNPYVFVSEDCGNSWTQIAQDLPLEPVNVVKEDPSCENIIYVGTDHGVYVSINAGESFMAFAKGLPDVAVHDLAIHPEKSDLILGTHGRSIYIADISGLQKLPQIKDKEIVLFPLEKIKASPYWGRKWSDYDEAMTPEISISWYTKTPEEINLTIYTESGEQLNTLKIKSNKGIQNYKYDLSISKDLLKTATKKNEKLKEIKTADNGINYLPKGSYRIELVKGTEKVSEVLIVE